MAEGAIPSHDESLPAVPEESRVDLLPQDDAECARCHEPYSTRGKKGPGLKGMFQRKYLSLSGLPANDDRVSDIIRLGRNEMPGYSQKLDAQQLQDLLAYLHTL